MGNVCVWGHVHPTTTRNTRHVPRNSQRLPQPCQRSSSTRGPSVAAPITSPLEALKHRPKRTENLTQPNLSD